MQSSSSLSTYWHTLRYLKPVQLYGRVGFKLARPGPDVRDAPPLRSSAGVWAEPARRTPSLTAPFRFKFLNDEQALDEAGWDRPDIAKLWRYNLHYFDDLNAAGAASRTEWHRALLLRWVRENPPGVGTGWEPYPTSLRIVNWIKWALRGQAVPPACLHSLAVQARWLSKRLERHLLGNHLFANAKALVFAGVYFVGPEADRWLVKGLRTLATEMPEQILADGGQFERSPMYHALALEDVLDLWNLLHAFPDAVPGRYRDFAQSLSEVAGRMRRWLAAMCHPDGEISFFNDAAFGIAPTADELEAYARRLGFPALAQPTDGVTHLAESGYIRVQRGPLVALLDVAPVGPDYLPGHAHADTLSFELSLFGQRVLVNSGTSEYGLGAERLRQRGTAAHNTVTVDGLNSSEVWGGFRVARRARPFDMRIDQRDGAIAVSCSHDGYRRLPGSPIHRREWRFEGSAITVRDTVTGPGAATSHWHWAPGIAIAETTNPFVAGLAGGHRLSCVGEGAHWRLANSTWHPEFGKTVPNSVLCGDFSGSMSTVRMEWS
jgi:uncharacterized heparinase superfamily protein